MLLGAGHGLRAILSDGSAGVNRANEARCETVSGPQPVDHRPPPAGSVAARGGERRARRPGRAGRRVSTNHSTRWV